ncbi:MAG: preprotein translocase subunit SecG [Bacilli bacterium]|nr:preprotein translocase subunit SecG [Bacilli bacterium]
MHFLDYIFLILAAIIIVVTLVQGGKGDGASSAIMGGMTRSYTDVKERGPEKVLSRVTFALSGLFFLFAILVRMFA